MRRLLVLTLVPLALVAAACSADRDEEAGGGGAGRAVEEAAQPQSAAGGLGAPAPAPQMQPDAAAVQAEGGDVLVESPVSAVGPRVIQTATLRLSVPRGRFEEAVEEARSVAAGLGGFVTSSTASRGAGRRLVRGTLVVRVPARSYARAMSALGDLGRVEGRREAGEDVSQEFVDLEARARHLEAVERQLLELLQRARTVTAALAVQSRLNETQLELEQVRGRLRFLDDQTEFATISLAIRERLPAAGGGDGDGWQLADAWADGVRGFVYVTGRIFVVLAWAAPIALLLGLVLLVVRLAVRRPILRLARYRGQTP